MIHFHSRKPEAEQRPAFTDIMVLLQKPDFQILKWSKEDIKSSSTAAITLGSSLEAGLGLHKDLRRAYLATTKPQEGSGMVGEKGKRRVEKDERKSNDILFDDDGCQLSKERFFTTKEN